MGLWADRILPRMMEFSLNTDAVLALRKEAFAEARGRVLEVGFGTGLTLAALPEAVTEVVALDPSPGMRALADDRIAAYGRPVHFQMLGGETLPFEDASFDTVLCAFTLCSIAEEGKALAEIRRVLKADGVFLFLEHCLSPDPGVARLQRWGNPLNRWLVGGCQLIKDTPALVEGAGLHVEKKRSFYFPEAPKVVGWFTIGQARRA